MDSLDAYLTRLASASPTPGGGSAATMVAAAGAALIAMVARICVASPNFAAQRELAAQLLEDAEGLRAELRADGTRDEAAFDAVVAAQALPRQSESEKQTRAVALERALCLAAQAPLDAGSRCLDVLRLADRASGIPNRNLMSDVGCAAEFAGAGLAGCAYNVRVNHRFMKDAATLAAQASALAELERKAAALLQNLRRGIAATLGSS